jgi:Flagellar hook-length control protein FliK
MTAPAAAPASAPVAAPPPRAAPQPPADAHAFAAVLDALPGGALKASASTAAEEPHPSSAKRLDQPPGQKPGHSLPGDGLLLASLPLAVQAASRIDGSPHAADPAPSRSAPAAKGPESEGGGASVAASARTAALGRLIGQRAFHFGASTSGMTRLALDSAFGPAAAPGAGLALRSDLGGGLPQVEALPAAALANAAPPGAGAPASAAVRAGPHDRPARAAPHEAARGERKAEVPAPAPAAKVGSAPAAPPAEPDGDGKAPGGRSPDPVAPLAQVGPFGAPLAAAAFGGAASFAPDGSAAGAGEVAPRANAQGPGVASTAPPVREIDVDLSPGGLEDVSMTMRLAGDRLSVVVRAGSSQTLSSIEGARDAIADRLAAIGQPLDSLIIQQTGVKADGATNGNAASADDGKAGDQWRPARGAGEGPGSNDANLNRRGAHRDRGF